MSTAMIRLLIGLTAGAMIWAGVERGEPSMILNKAARVCLECIGLG